MKNNSHYSIIVDGSMHSVVSTQALALKTAKRLFNEYHNRCITVECSKGYIIEMLRRTND